MAISVKQALDNGYYEMFPGAKDGIGAGGAEGGLGAGAAAGGGLGVLAWLLSELFYTPKEGKPNISEFKTNTKGKDMTAIGAQPNYGDWPGSGNLIQTLPENPGHIVPRSGKDMTKVEAQPNYGDWPGSGNLIQTLPENPGHIVPGSGKDMTAIGALPNYGDWPGSGDLIQTLPENPGHIVPGSGKDMTAIGAQPNYGDWPGSGDLIQTLPENPGHIVPGSGKDMTAIGAQPNYGDWPDSGKLVQTLPNQMPNDEKKENKWEAMLPMITDKTEENKETTINPVSFDNIYELLKAEQKAQWDREDFLRYENWSREDSAYTRAVEDMFRAGINPNLMNVQPAESGGGITNATGMNYQMWEAELSKEIALLQQSIDQNFKGDENDKDRFTQILGNVLSMFSVIAMFKGKI